MLFENKDMLKTECYRKKKSRQISRDFLTNYLAYFKTIYKTALFNLNFEDSLFDFLAFSVFNCCKMSVIGIADKEIAFA